MKATTLKTFLDVHTWTGLGAGMALFICFYTGALTVFTHELEDWDTINATAPAEQNYQQAQQLLDTTLAQHPNSAASVRLILSEPDQPGHRTRWFERQDDGSFEGMEFNLANNGELIPVDHGSHLSDFIYRLHYTAGLPASLGLYVLGFICVLYGIALVSGVVIFAPNFLKDLFIVRTGRNKKRFWLDTHNVVGVLSLPWHVMFAWSSAVLAIGTFMLAPFQFTVFEEDLIALLGPELGLPPALEVTGEPAAMLSVEQMIALAQRELPEMKPWRLRFANAGDRNGSVMVSGWVDTDALVKYGAVTLTTATGEVLGVSNPATTTAGSTFYRGLIALHYADFSGYTVRWVYFLLGLAGAFLFYSGNLLWVESRRKRRQAAQTGSTLFLARLNSGVCIGCMAGVSAAFLASRALIGFDEREAFTEWAYFVVFFAAIGWCFLRPVARGARDLLYLSAVFTALIPLFDAIYVGLPFWQAIALGHWEVMWVQLLSLMGALTFWWMGRAVQRRALHGDANSVWALPQGSRSPAGATAPAEVPLPD